MKKQNVTLGLIALDIACAFLAALNAYMNRLYNETNAIIWGVVAVIWTIVIIRNFLKYQKQMKQ